MTIEILASGSKGNVTAVKSGESLFLIDCGKTFRWTIERLNNRLPDALLITHEHSDHAKAAKNFLTRGVEVYMTAGTATALNLGERHNLHTIAEGKTFTVAGVEVTPIESVHDAAEPVNFILQDADDRVLFVTDTGNVPNVEGDFNKILIEANYSMPLLMGSNAFYNLKNRIMESHLSFEAAQKFLQGYPNAEVTLLHVSKRHGDEEDFYRRLRRTNNGNERFEGAFDGMGAETRKATWQRRFEIHDDAVEHLHEQQTAGKMRSEQHNRGGNARNDFETFNFTELGASLRRALR